jgi:hypothetical protein
MILKVSRMSLLHGKFIGVITVSYSALFCCNATRNSNSTTYSLKIGVIAKVLHLQDACLLVVNRKSQMKQGGKN